MHGSQYFRNDSMANKLTMHFDKPWGMNRSTLRAKTADERSYDPSHSWDAISDDPRAFTRLEATEMPVQEAHPVTMSGGAMVELERKTDGLKVLNGYQPSTTLRPIPLTMEQKDVEMVEETLSGYNKLEQRAREEGKKVVMEMPAYFANMQVRAPALKGLQAPKALRESGPQCDQRLLNPQQRREIADYERKMHAGELYLKEAKMARGKTFKQVRGPNFHRGILMVDTATNDASEVYGDRAKAYRAKYEKKEEMAVKRRDRLSEVWSSMDKKGNILNPKSMTTTVRTTKEFQSKCMKNTQLPVEETHARLFPPKLQKEGFQARAQYLRDQDICGKNWNIVSHTQVSHWPSNVPIRHDIRAGHESQTSLHGRRNTQGILINRKYTSNSLIG